MAKDTQQDKKIKDDEKEEKPFFFRWRFIVITILVLLKAFSNYNERKYTNPKSNSPNLNRTTTIINDFLDNDSKNK